MQNNVADEPRTGCNHRTGRIGPNVRPLRDTALIEDQQRLLQAQIDDAAADSDVT